MTRFAMTPIYIYRSRGAFFNDANYIEIYHSLYLFCAKFMKISFNMRSWGVVIYQGTLNSLVFINKSMNYFSFNKINGLSLPIT